MNDHVIDLSSGLLLRRFRDEDAEGLVVHANDQEVARNLRARFPYPYRIEDGRFFVEQVATAPETDIFAIVFEGSVIGAIGLDHLGDVYARTIELGYWIGREFAGRGLATRVVAAAVARAFREYPEVIRVQARVFGGNDASTRVLEKNGFSLEAVHRRAITRFGETRDELYFVRFREVLGPASEIPPPLATFARKPAEDDED